MLVSPSQVQGNGVTYRHFGGSNPSTSTVALSDKVCSRHTTEKTLIHPTLYKRTSTGATQIWYREQVGAKYRTVSGQIDGKKVESGWTTAQPKNVGRANATTAEEQADLEIAADYKKKLAQGGYHESIDNIDEAKFYKPMLAKNYNDYPLQPGEVRYSQPKLDGVRCIAMKSGLFTRQGKELEACPHIHAQLQPFFEKNPTAVLDGELYADKLAQDFNKIISLVRKKKPAQANLDESARTVEYHVYDYPSYEGTFAERSDALFEGLRGIGGMIKLVATCKVESVQDLDDLYGMYIEDGYEGQMVRSDDTLYEQKRSKSLLKRKEFNDAEYKVVEICEGEGNRTGMAGFITYELGDGRTFGSGIKGTHEYCKGLLKEAADYVGGTGTVQYFGLTPDGVPRFPVTVALFKGERDI